MKKALSLFLCLLLAAAVLVPSAAAKTNQDLPIVFVGGRGTKLVDKEGNQIYPIRDTDDYIKEQAKLILPIFGKAVMTDNYEEYCDALVNAVAPVYEKMRLDEDGNVSNGSYSPFTWSREQLRRKVRGEGNLYDISDFRFYYDWRLDMWEVADQLHEYIKAVCEVTGKPKVRLIGRCMGGNLVSAYITKYGSGLVEKCLFHMTSANGTILVGSPFSGEMNFDGRAVARYVSDILGDEMLDELIRSTLNLYTAFTGMRAPINFVEFIYSKIAPLVLPRLVLSAYGSFPSYWQMIGPEQYEKAKKNVFAGQEARYHKFIEKTDNYHYNVMRPLYSTVKNLENAGTEFYVITKYGKTSVPIVSEPDVLTDNTVELSTASFGATCAPITGTLTDEYIKGRTEEGFGKYISPDRQVDASTCLLPEKTWFLKFSVHKDFCRAIDELLMTILRYDGDMTVNDDARYPQFMVEDEKNKVIYPMTEENCEPVKKYNPNIFEALKSFFAILIRYIADFFENGFTSK